MFTAVFHSFKGGAGRSVTTFNTLPFLVKKLKATPEYPILLIDMDVDSRGMTILLDKDKEYKTNEFDVKKFFVNPANTFQMTKSDSFDTHVFFKCTYPVGDKVGVDDGAIRFFGVDDEHNEEFSQEDVTPKVLERIISTCKNRGFKAVIFDSAAGDQNAAIKSIQKSDIIVSCMRPTSQFRESTFTFLSRLVKDQIAKRETRIIINPTCVPTDDDRPILKKRSLDDFIEKFNNLEMFIQQFPDIYKELLVRKMIEEPHFGIPEVKRFKWNESNLHKDSLSEPLDSDEKKALGEYEFLAECIVEAAER